MLILACYQGCDGSRYRFGRPWIEANFWLWVEFFDPISANAIILKYLSIVSKNLEAASGSRSENQFLWFGNSLACYTCFTEDLACGCARDWLEINS